MAAEPAGLAKVIRQTLTNPHSEQRIRTQMLGLAAQNLHQPDVLTALIEVLPEVQDVDTRRQLLALLMDTDASRFPSLDALYSALVGALQTER